MTNPAQTAGGTEGQRGERATKGKRRSGRMEACGYMVRSRGSSKFVRHCNPESSRFALDQRHDCDKPAPLATSDLPLVPPLIVPDFSTAGRRSNSGLSLGAGCCETFDSFTRVRVHKTAMGPCNLTAALYM